MKLLERFERLIALQLVGTELNHPNWRVVAPEVGKAVPVELVAPNVFPQSRSSSIVADLAPDKGQKKPRMAKSAIREFFLRVVICTFLIVDPLVFLGYLAITWGAKAIFCLTLLTIRNASPTPRTLSSETAPPVDLTKLLPLLW